jgi:hypothetical protein
MAAVNRAERTKSRSLRDDKRKADRCRMTTKAGEFATWGEVISSKIERVAPSMAAMQA